MEHQTHTEQATSSELVEQTPSELVEQTSDCTGTYPPVTTEEQRIENENFQKTFWRNTHHNIVIDDAVRPIVYKLTRDERDSVETWTGIRNSLASIFATQNCTSVDLNDLPYNDIIKKYHKKFDEAFTCVRFRDYHEDHKTKSVASEPNEKIDTTHIDINLYMKYFKGLKPLMVCYISGPAAEGCVRAKLTHRVNAILAICKIAMEQEEDPETKKCIGYWVNSIEFYANEAHYMSDDPNAEMRFDDN